MNLPYKKWKKLWKDKTYGIARKQKARIERRKFGFVQSESFTTGKVIKFQRLVMLFIIRKKIKLVNMLKT